MKSRSVTIWVMMVVLCFSLVKARAVIVFDDGQTHTVDYLIYDQVQIRDSSFWLEPTTVNFVEGGDATGDVVVSETSVLNTSMNFMELSGL